MNALSVINAEGRKVVGQPKFVNNVDNWIRKESFLDVLYKENYLIKNSVFM